MALPDVTAAITAAYLATLDARLRVAVEALSVVRRGTASLLATMLPGGSAALPGELARLPFVQVTVDGLALHDAIRVPVAAALEGVDPSRYAGYRQAAWQVVDRELRAARAPDIWRYTADLLYLIDHPLVREASFPPSALQQDVLLLLATLSRAAGEARSDASAALWLDIKRTYLDRRDRLRRVHAIVVDAQGFLETARPLGFAAVGGPVEVDGVVHHITLLDFGPSCVDGWLSWLAGEQVGHPPSALRLEPDTRTARLRDRDVTLSQLEFGLLDHLVRRGGRPVSRSDLIREVWGHDYAGGSNVVDAVVRTPRRKLGPASHVVEAVRGVGYRYAADALDDRTVR